MNVQCFNARKEFNLATGSINSNVNSKIMSQLCCDDTTDQIEGASAKNCAKEFECKVYDNEDSMIVNANNYKQRIASTFDILTDKLKQREEDLTQTLEATLFGKNKRNNDTDIKSCEITFDTNIISNIEAMIDILGQIRPISNNHNCSEEFEMKSANTSNTNNNPENNDTASMMNQCLTTDGSETIIDSTIQLESDIVHKYNTLIIKKGGIITVPNANINDNENIKDTTTNKSKQGGILRIKCVSLVIENGGCIDVSGKGYLGGQKPGS